MGIKEFLQHLSKGSIRRAFMGNRGTWNQSGRKRVGVEKRSWLGRTKNKVGNFFFGARGKSNNQRKYLGRVKNYVEAGLKKIPFVGRRVTRSRNNRGNQQAAPSSGSWWWPWGSRKPNNPSRTSYIIVPDNTVIPAELEKETNANLNSIKHLQNLQMLEKRRQAEAAEAAAKAAAKAAGAAAAEPRQGAEAVKAAAVAGVEAVKSLSPNPSALQKLAGAQAGIQAAVQNNPSLKPGNLSSRMQSATSLATTLEPLLKPKSSTGKGLTSSQRRSAVTAGRKAASIQRAAAAGTRSLPPRSSPRAFGQAAAAATLASIPSRLRTLPRYVENMMPELFGTRKSTKSPLLLLKNKPKSPATVGQSRKNRRGPVRSLLRLQPRLNSINKSLRNAENAGLRQFIPYMAATQAHTGTQSDRLKALLAANQGAAAATPRWIEKGNAIDKEIRLKKMLEKAHPTSPVGSPKTPKGGASTENPSKRQRHRFGKEIF
jgi:hypothetical protein